MVNNPLANAGDLRDMSLIPGFGKIPWRTWQPTLIILPGESYEQRRLAGYSPQGRNELNITEVTSHINHFHCGSIFSTSLLVFVVIIFFYFSHLVAVNICPMNVSSQEEICLIGK